jgi:hypothetical protein
MVGNEEGRMIASQEQINLVNHWVNQVVPRVIQVFGFFDNGVSHSFARSADETNDEYDSP